MPLATQRECTLAGGDDYELVFTAPSQRTAQVLEAARAAHVEVTRIGSISAVAGLRLLDRDNQVIANTFASFDHFKTSGPSAGPPHAGSPREVASAQGIPAGAGPLGVAPLAPPCGSPKV
jgi:hypothetical protein